MSQPEHLRFYDVACQHGQGRKAVGVWLRRGLRRMLLPSSMRLVDILMSLIHRLDVDEAEIHRLRADVNHLNQRQDELATKLPATIAFGWDYVAMSRRLAALEDHVERLLQAQAAGGSTASGAQLKFDRAEEPRPMGPGTLGSVRTSVTH